MFHENLIVKRVPKWIVNRTRENMNCYNMGLYDAFNEAVKNYPGRNARLRNAWYFSDYREFIPNAYNKEYLDFKEYPLPY